jgi:hypothetical protein
VDVSR